VTSSGTLRRLAITRRVDALFRAMSTDYLLREQFVTAPSQVISEYVNGKTLSEQGTAATDLLIYSVMANQRLIVWIRDFAVRHHGEPPSPSRFIRDFSRAIVEHAGHLAVMALFRSVIEKGSVLNSESADDIVSAILSIFGPTSDIGIFPNPFTGTQQPITRSPFTGTETGTGITGTGTGTFGTGTGTGTGGTFTAPGTFVITMPITGTGSTGTGTGSTGTGTGSTGTGTGSTGTGTGSTGTGTGSTGTGTGSTGTGTGSTGTGTGSTGTGTGSTGTGDTGTGDTGDTGTDDTGGGGGGGGGGALTEHKGPAEEVALTGVGTTFGGFTGDPAVSEFAREFTASNYVTVSLVALHQYATELARSGILDVIEE
jgi:hypothetical protein